VQEEFKIIWDGHFVLMIKLIIREVTKPENVDLLNIDSIYRGKIIKRETTNQISH
jgi:hypothetical protein